jgi:lipocalin
MGIITETVIVAASRKTTYWLAQRNPNLPYSDIDSMVKIAKSEGALVTQVGKDRFLVNNTAWVNYAGCVTPL